MSKIIIIAFIKISLLEIVINKYLIFVLLISI